MVCTCTVVESVKHQQGGRCSVGKSAGSLLLSAQNNRTGNSPMWLFLEDSSGPLLQRAGVKTCSQDPAPTQAGRLANRTLPPFHHQGFWILKAANCTGEKNHAMIDNIGHSFKRFLTPVGTEASTQSLNEKGSPGLYFCLQWLLPVLQFLLGIMQQLIATPFSQHPPPKKKSPTYYCTSVASDSQLFF